MFVRTTLLKQTAASLNRFFGDLSLNNLDFMIIRRADRQAAEAAKEIIRQQIETEVLAGAREGYGFLAIAGSPKTLCLLQAEAEHSILVAQSLAVIRDYQRSFDEIKTVATTKENAFISAKRNLCGIIYGGSEALKEIAEGLRRDKVNYKFLEAWVSHADASAIRVPAPEHPDQ